MVRCFRGKKCSRWRAVARRASLQEELKVEFLERNRSGARPLALDLGPVEEAFQGAILGTRVVDVRNVCRVSV